MNWKMWLSMAIPIIRNAGIQKKNEDANSTGRDDIIGASLIYIADLLEAIVADKELPKAPSVLR